MKSWKLVSQCSLLGELVSPLLTGEFMLPRIGDTVVVRHTVTYDEHGVPYLVSTKDKETVVKYVYLDGQVQVVSGDVWEVKPFGAKWVTIAKGLGR